MLFASFLLLALNVEVDPVEFAGVTIVSTPLAEVVDRFGNAPRWHTGDAGEAEDKICYRLQGSAPPRFVYFISGEIGGGVDLTNVRVTTVGDPRCVAPKYAGSVLAEAVALYTDAAAAQERLTRAGFTPDGPRRWSRCVKKDVRGESFDDCASFRLEYRHRQLSLLELSATLTD